jgi:hypothetical protein
MELSDLGTTSTAQSNLANLALTQGDKGDLGGHK